MEERPKNVRKPAAKGKGFYVAMYASLGGLLLLALAIGYFNFLGPGAVTGEADAHLISGNLFEQDLADTEYWPVGSQWDMPIGGRLQPTPTPAPPPDDETGRPTQPAPRPGDATEGQAQPVPSPPPAEPEDDETTQTRDGDAYHGDETGADEASIYNVFEPPAPSFTHFADGDSMHWPVLGDVLMDFALDRLIYDPTLDQWRTNDKLAISANRGDTVRAAAAGRVYQIVETRQFGQKVVIDHGNGWFTTYSQLDPDMAVSEGDVVSRGQIIGAVGSPSIFTSRIGYHVGFSVSNNDTPIDPNTLLTTAE